MEKLSSPSGYSDTCEGTTIKPETVGRLTNCQHSFHMLCMLAMYSNGNKVLSWPGPTGSPVPEWPGRGALTAASLLAGREFAVPLLQNHLRGENWDAAQREDGGLHLPPVPPWPQGLWDNPDRVSHQQRHPGEGTALTGCESLPLQSNTVVEQPEVPAVTTWLVFSEWVTRVSSMKDVFQL